VKNAVRMIQPFYSEKATVEKARSVWNLFERTANGLSDSVRLKAFRVLLKGKTDEDWWMYSRIEGFATLRARFYNQFICQTPLQMIERLKNAKCSKDMSVVVWASVIANLCDAAQVANPQMRYQYFFTGLRNNEWKTALQTTMVNDIPRAVTTLLYKNMHLRTEDEAEFACEVTKKPNYEESMMQQMLGLIQLTQNLLVTQNHESAAIAETNYQDNMKVNATKYVVADVADATVITVASAPPTCAENTAASSEENSRVELIAVGAEQVGEQFDNVDDVEVINNIVVSYAAKSTGDVDTVLDGVSALNTESEGQPTPFAAHTVEEITTNETLERVFGVDDDNTV
ncbi:hypothetical protein PHMEG_00031384, partial [Phytophthora megakarya]